jgi:hypothetical protein
MLIWLARANPVRAIQPTWSMKGTQMPRLLPRFLLILLASVFCLISLASAQPGACKQGFVWREAFPGDQVCVTPETRAQVQADNRTAATRRVAPNNDACIRGYVWREASPQDHVCVTVQTRAQAQEDNRVAGTRLGAGGGGFMASSAPQQSNPAPIGQHIEAGTEMQVSKPSRLQARPRPAPLTEVDLNGQAPRLKIQPGRIRLPGVYSPNIRYQLENFNNQVGAEVNTTNVESADFYGATGYVEIDFNVLPGKQFMLDCSVGDNGTYKVGTTFVDSHGNGPNYTGGPMTAFSQHLLIPLNPAPGNAATAKVVISFTEVTFYGCVVDTVN